MSARPSVAMLSEPDRSLMLQAFLTVLNRHPDLAHFRLLATCSTDRQLALFAALERSACVGLPLAFPPQPDDHADALLCDILDALDQDPLTSNHGAYYGPDRHLVNLQALGLWQGEQPVHQPTARELFTTRFAELTAEPATDLHAAGANKSPLLQDSAPGGELIEHPASSADATNTAKHSSQLIDIVLVNATGHSPEPADFASSSVGIIHRQGNRSGEELPAPVGNALRGVPNSSLADSHDVELVPARPVRRGRPLLLDERAKGRVLGLMAYGLSLRQAAAQLGIHHTTLVAAIKRDEEFAQQVSEARLDAISQPLLTVVQASRRSWRTAAWLAKFLDDRRTSRHEPPPDENLHKQLRS